ncbi:MAG: serpin family protein [Actinomycetota bacterium]
MSRSRSSTFRLAAIIAALGVTGAGFASCGDDDDDDDGSGADTPGVGVLAADVERAPLEPAAATQAADAITAFGLDLYGAARTGDGNLAVSPYSVAAALSMTRVGASGATADEMDDVLHADVVDDLAVAFGSLDGALATRPGEFPVPDGDPLELELSFANALWPQDGFPFEEEFLEELGRHYGAGVNMVDYVADAEGARESINAWVAGETRDRTPELIPAGVVGAATRLVLTNALYLKAPWEFPFAGNATTEGEFRLLDGSTVTTPLMSLNEGLGHGTGDGWATVRLPYVGGDLSMTVLVPDDGRFEEIEAALDGALLAAIDESISSRTVQLALPSWEYRTQLNLNEPLRQLGMETAFDDRADFSAMSPESLFISDVVHEVFIAVDEEGTEAAAATAVVMAESAAAEPVVLTVDRPFLYWIVDEPTGAVLFLGRVLDPTHE